MTHFYNPVDGSVWQHDPPAGCIEIAPADLPTVLAECSRGNLPRLESGAWVIYTPDDPPPDVFARIVRTQRDRELRESDWTQQPDSPLTPQQRSAWARYRQDLRDLPQRYAGIASPPFPRKPT